MTTKQDVDRALVEADADEMYSWIEAQVALGARRPGSPADQASETMLADMLTDFGLQAVRKEPIDVAHWQPERTTLSVDGRPLDCFPIPYAAYTPKAGVDAELVYADASRVVQRGDWSGRIVVTDIRFPPLNIGLLSRLSFGMHDPDDSVARVNHPATWVRLGWHIYGQAVRRGAAGFVGILRDQPGGSCRMYGPYGFREKNILDKPLPGVWVGRDHGDTLRAAARAGRRARLISRGVHEPSVTHNVVGEVPGDGTREAVVLSCHHDSPFASPVEDASGVSVVLALARHIARTRPLRRRLVVLLSAGHFYGSIGTRTFIEQHRNDVVRDTALEVSIEHIALEAEEGPTGELRPTGLPEAAGLFAPFSGEASKLLLDALVRHDLRRCVLLPPEGPLGDYPPTDGGDWYEAGVPVINYISNPVYLLTDDDAPRWVDRARLQRVAAAFADTLCAMDRLSKADIARVDSRARLYLMKALKTVVRAKTTKFGLCPVY